MRVRIEIPDRTRPRRHEDEGRVAVALEELEASPGRPLPEEVRREMEARFGCDFSEVRIHQDTRADSSAQALGARAFTVGNHIFFRAGAFDPDRIDGRRLLAHELAHTLQQRAGVDGLPTRGLGLEPAAVSIAEEHRARDAAEAALAAKPVGPTGIARQPAGSQAAPHVARWVEARPDDRASASPANPFVEELALDVVRALQRDPDDTGAHTQRRLARLQDGTRAAVITRVQEILTPAERERSAKALSGAAVLEEEPRREPQPAAEPPAGQQPARTREERDRAERGEEPAGPPESEIEKPAPATAPAPAESTAAAPAAKPKPTAERPAAKLTALGDRAKRPAGAPTAAPAPAAKVLGKQPPLAAIAGQAAEKAAPAVGQKLGGRPPEEASPAAAAAQADGGDAGAQPDLGPATELEAKVDAKDRERQARAEARAQEIEKKAAEDAAAAPAAAAAQAPLAPAEPAEHSEALTTLEEVAATDAGGEPESATAAPPEPPAAVGPDEAPAPAEPEPAEGAPPEPEPATEPEPETAAEPEAAAVAEPEPAMPPEPAPTPEPTPEPEPTTAAAEPMTTTAPAAVEESAPPHESAPTVEREASSAVRDETPGGEAAVPAPAEESVQAETAEAPVAEAAAAPTTDGAAEPPAAEQTATEDGAAGAADEGAGAEAGGEGGDCGPDSAPGVGGGGGGGAAIADPQPEPEPDVSQAAPEEAMATAATLAPGPLVRTLGGVQAAAQREVAGKRDDLAANPPSLERPSGSPQTRDGRRAPGAEAAGGPGSTRGHADRSRSRTPAPKEVPPALPPAPPSPTQAIQPPPINQGTQAPMTPQEVQAFASSIGRLPVSDPGLNVTAGPPPTLALTGDADPTQVTEQRSNVDHAVDAAAQEGAQAAAAPFGEHNIYPAVPPEVLRAEAKAAPAATGAPAVPTAAAAPAATAAPPKPATAPAPGVAPAAPPVAGLAGAPGIGAAAPAAAAGGPAGADPAEIIAKEQSTAEVQAAAIDGQGQMVAGREAQEGGVDKANADTKAEIDKEVADNAKAQEDQRNQTLSQVGRERGSWTKEQQDAVTKHATDSDEQMRRVDTEVTDRRAKADKDAAAEIQKGNDDAAKERRKAEDKAAAERKRAEQESDSGGVLGWIADKARSFFNAIKSAIKGIFDAARKLVRAVINAAISLANKIIDAARDAIVSAIRSIGDALLKLGDVLLSSFPALHERYRKAIHGMVDAAVKKVDELADGLKAAVKKALNALADAIEAVFALYEKALLAAVSFVQKAAEAVISAARAVVEMLAQWAQLIADIASDPLQWLSNLGSSALDGIKNHLWRAFKCAVKAWFRSKVEEVLGLPLALFQLLKRGGIKFADIAKMVWEGLKAAIPGILIQLAIEKIVAMLVPAAGAIMAIIEGLKAAWGTIKRIIAAFEKFFAFLKAVKAGNAGRQFAEMIAAAVIVVLDFLANFLINRLMKPAKPIGGRLAEIGKKIMARLGSVARAIGRGVRRAGQVIKAAAKRAVAVVRRGAAALKQAAVKAGRAIAKVAGRVGRALKRGAGKVVGAVRKGAGRAMRVIERRFPRVAGILKKGAGLVRRVGRGIGRARRWAARKWRRAKAWARHKRQQFRRWREERRRRAMERAQAELPQRIHRMLQNGWPQPAMWLALRAWKLWYGLRVLALRTRGPQAEVEAANSPPSVLVSGIVMGWRADIGTRIRELEDEVIEDAEVKRVARHIMDQRRRGFGSEERPIEIPPSPGGLAAARDLRLLAQMEGRIPGQGRVAGGWRVSFGSRLRAGKIAEAEHFLLAPGLAPTREAAYRSLHPGSILVGGAGRYATGVLARPPDDAQRFMAGVLNVQRGGPPIGLADAEAAGRAAELGRLGQVEMARGGIFSESVGSELASRAPAPGGAPLLSFEERYGARQPMAREQAGRISRAARARLGLEPIPGLGRGSASEEEVQAFLRDEMALVARFVELQVVAQRELYDNEEAIRRYIKRHLIDHLRVVLTAMAATGQRPGGRR